MDTDIAAQSCHRCQIWWKDDQPLPALLSALPQPTEPNQREHADLFGPLKTSDSGKKFILCMTHALTKYVELVPLQNKEATTVAEAIFDKLICHFGVPIDLVTDLGQEFCAKLSDDLLKRLCPALPRHLITLSATARQMWPTKQSLNTWPFFATTQH